MYQILNAQKQVVGHSASWFEALPGFHLQPLTAPLEPDLEELKGEKIGAIRREVQRRLQAEAWRIERAKERDAIGAPGESLAEVYAQREALRRAGNRAELEIQALDSLEALQSYVFTVEERDCPRASKITRLAFLRRFSVEERRQLSAIRSQNSTLDDFWRLLEVAINIDLHDPEIRLGVHFLEQLGLLQPGRAATILSLEASHD